MCAFLGLVAGIWLFVVSWSGELSVAYVAFCGTLTVCMVAFGLNV